MSLQAPAIPLSSAGAASAGGRSLVARRQAASADRFQSLLDAHQEAQDRQRLRTASLRPTHAVVKPDPGAGSADAGASPSHRRVSPDPEPSADPPLTRPDSSQTHVVQPPAPASPGVAADPSAPTHAEPSTTLPAGAPLVAAPAVPMAGAAATQATASADAAQDGADGDAGSSLPEPAAPAAATASAAQAAASAADASAAPAPLVSAPPLGGAQPLLLAAKAAGATLVKARAVGLAPGKAAEPAGPAAPAAADLAGPAPTGDATPASSDDGAAPDGDGGSPSSGEGQGGTSADASAAGGASAAPATPAFSLATDAATAAGGAASTLSASAADLAAQMAARVVAGSSRFKLQLNPLGLGQVEVTVTIGSDKAMTAALAFSDPHAAHALSAHAGELKAVLEQAGFTLPQGFDFSSPAGGLALSGGGGGGQAGQDATDRHAPGRVAGLSGAVEPAAPARASYAAGAGDDGRLDIRI